MREIGGRNVRFTASPDTARFGLGTWASINETLSTAGFGAGSDTAGGGAGAAFLAVIGANADFVAGGGAVIAGVAFASDLTAPATSSLVALELLAGLTAARERIDDLAEVADFATLLADALGAVVLVVVFVAIQVP